MTFLILLRTEGTLLSSAFFFHEAPTRTSEEMQAWKQPQSMNFLCSNCIVGFLCVFCHIFYWYLCLRGSQHQQTPARLTFPVSEGIIWQPWIRWLLQRRLVKAPSGGASVHPTFANAVRNLLCATRGKWKSFSVVWNRTTLSRYLDDWRLQLPRQQEARGVDRNSSSSDDATKGVTEVCLIRSKAFHHFYLSFILILIK